MFTTSSDTSGVFLMCFCHNIASPPLMVNAEWQGSAHKLHWQYFQISWTLIQSREVCVCVLKAIPDIMLASGPSCREVKGSGMIWLDLACCEKQSLLRSAMGVESVISIEHASSPQEQLTLLPDDTQMHTSTGALSASEKKCVAQCDSVRPGCHILHSQKKSTKQCFCSWFLSFSTMLRFKWNYLRYYKNKSYFWENLKLWLSNIQKTLRKVIPNTIYITIQK